MRTREDLKKDTARKERKEVIAQGWGITESNWTKKKRARAANP